MYITLDPFKLLSLSSNSWNVTRVLWKCNELVDWTIGMNVWNRYEILWILIVLMYYFPTEFLRKEKNRKWISFLKAIYAHKLVDLFCCCGFECKREDEEKEEKLNIQFIFRLSVPPHIWKQDRKKYNLCFRFIANFAF